MYKIVFGQDAEKQFKKLEKEVQNRICNALKRIEVRPYSFVEKLVGFPYYKLRIGHYRIILDIKNNENILFIMKIGHRKDIYKNFNIK